MSKVVCISMARMTSSRLRGKPLMKVGGLTMIECHLKRLRNATRIDEVVLATTINEEDDPLVKHCEDIDMNYFRGSEDDVLDRYYQCAKAHNADIVVRVTGDCPFVDPDLLDKTIDHYFTSGTDYAHLDISKFPRGFDCEVFSFAILEEAWQNSNEKFYREHVTPYIYKSPGRFKLSSYSTDVDFSSYRLCVDEEADLEMVNELASHIKTDLTKVSWDGIIKILEANPHIKSLNENVMQKSDV